MYDEDYCNYQYYEKIHWFDIKTWDFCELKFMTKQKSTEYFSSSRFYNGLEFMENAREILEKLNNVYDISIVSMGTYANLKGKYKWIHDNLPFCFTHLLPTEFHYDKSNIDMRNGIMIDDHALLLHSCNADTKILYGEKMDYNSGWIGTRCVNWTEIYKLLTEK